MPIKCTQCGASINIIDAQKHKNYVKCPQCDNWEEYSEDVKSGKFLSLAGKDGEAFCLGCRRLSPKTNLFYNKRADSYYHENCLPVGSELLIKCPNCGQYTANDSTFCLKCGKKLIEDAVRTVKYCEKCESEYEETDEFCKKDGNILILKEVKVDPSDIQPPPPMANKQEAISKEKTEDELGFGLANLWIGLQTTSVVVWIALALTLYNDSGEPFLLIIASFSIPSALTAYGVYLRTRWGIFATYTYLGLFLLSGVVKFAPENPIFLFIQMLIASMWFVYFENRSKYLT